MEPVLQPRKSPDKFKVSTSHNVVSCKARIIGKRGYAEGRTQQSLDNLINFTRILSIDVR